MSRMCMTNIVVYIVFFLYAFFYFCHDKRPDPTDDPTDDPTEGWCGERGRKSPAYPIRLLVPKL